MVRRGSPDFFGEMETINGGVAGGGTPKDANRQKESTHGRRGGTNAATCGEQGREK